MQHPDHDGSRDTGELAAVPIEYLHQRLRAVAEQMPAIRDLDRPGGAATHAIGVGTGAVTSHDLDAGMPLQPVGHGGGLAVGQQVDDLASFQIAQDRAVALTAPPGPIVDASTRGARSACAGARPRTRRSSVSGLTGRPRRPARRAPTSPPSADRGGAEGPRGGECGLRRPEQRRRGARRRHGAGSMAAGNAIAASGPR